MAQPLVTHRIRVVSKEILAEHPLGLTKEQLARHVAAILPQKTEHATITTQIGLLPKLYPTEVVMPRRGFYRRATIKIGTPAPTARPTNGRESTRFRLTYESVQAARAVFAEKEPRDLFYRASTELVELAWRQKIRLSLAEALAVLLQTWNKAFYRYRPFKQEHYVAIERLLAAHQHSVADFRERSITTFCESDEAVAQEVFGSFERILWPVGAAKSLHLLAPHFFPLWDRKIAAAYGCKLAAAGSNAKQYLRFIWIVKDQTENLAKSVDAICDPVKAIDEYNYVVHTKNWALREGAQIST